MLTGAQDILVTQESMLIEWEWYVAKKFSLEVKFDSLLMERYVYLIFQSYQVTQVVDNLVDKMEEMMENIKFSKFRIEYIPNPPQSSLECYLVNYMSFKKMNK